jgi:hypothetical protein
MKALDRRRAPYRPRLEFAIGLLGIVLFGIGIGFVAAGAKPDARVSTPSPTTTTATLINSSVIKPATTTTTTAQPAPTRKLRPVSRPPQIGTAISIVSEATTTTTEAPQTPLEVAQSQLARPARMPRAAIGAPSSSTG